MFFDKALVAEANAQEIANTVAAFLRGELEDQFFKLVTTKLDGTCKEVLWLTVSSNVQPVATLPKTEWVKCETEDGRQVDLFIPVKHRETGVVLVLIAESPTPIRP